MMKLRGSEGETEKLANLARRAYSRTARHGASPEGRSPRSIQCKMLKVEMNNNTRRWGLISSVRANNLVKQSMIKKRGRGYTNKKSHTT